MSSGKSEPFSADLLALIFNGTTIAGLAQNAVSTPLTTFYVALHTGQPDLTAGNQTVNEAAYTGYARQAVARTSGGWVITGAVVNPTANVTFPTATGGSETETFFSIGTAATGAGLLLYAGLINPPIVVNTNVTPQLTTLTQATEQ